MCHYLCAINSFYSNFCWLLRFQHANFLLAHQGEPFYPIFCLIRQIVHDCPKCNTPSTLSDDKLWTYIYAFPFQGCSPLVKGMFQISEEMSRELSISVTYSLGGRRNRLFTNKWFALFYSIICYTLFSKQIGSSCQTSVNETLAMKLCTCLKWCLRVHIDLSTMHALTCLSPKIKKASNSHLIVYFTCQAKISDEVLITLYILFIKQFCISLSYCLVPFLCRVLGKGQGTYAL